MGDYIVKKNDTLWDLAYGNNTTVNDILKLNPSITNPNLINVGQTIKIPGLTDNSNSGSSGNSSTNSGYTYQKHEYTPFQKSEALQDAERKNSSAYYAHKDFVDAGFNFSQADAHKAATDQYNAWLNNGFSYDFNQDALYQQYKDKYIKQGKMAMQDTMGQAAAITGGYGNSYAATVGNQAYQASLENLNDVIPELYQMAYNMHQDKGANYLNQIGLYDKERAYEYGVWSDTANRLDSDRAYAQSVADSIYNREYGAWNDNRTYSQTEHHNSENMRYQDIRDAIADEQWQKNYDLNDRQVKLDEDKWNYQKNNTSPGGKKAEEEDDAPQPYTTEYYTDWDALDWESYFAEIRNSESSEAAVEELQKFTSKGLIPTNMVVYASIGARGKFGH